MNATFRLHDEDLEPLFIKQAQDRGLLSLKGHRTVGGMRASMYNALPIEAVESLVDFMDEFERTHG
jgi:phosphoserine aminotransferase